MNVKATKTFLYIGNSVIALLCALAILGYFILPLWQMNITVNITPELVDQISNSLESHEDKNDTASAAFIFGEDRSVGYTADDGFDSDAVDSIVQAVIKTIGESNLSFSYTLGLDTLTVIRSIVDNNTAVIDAEIDRAVDAFINTSGEIISGVVEAVVVSVAKEVVKAQINDMIKNNLEYPDVGKFLEDIGADDDYFEGLIRRVIDAIMADDATVAGVCDTVMSVVDDFIELYGKNEKYSADVGKITDADKANIRKRVSDAVSFFADESGKLIVKDTLVAMLLLFVGDNLPKLQNNDTRSTAANPGAQFVSYASFRIGNDASEIAYTDASSDAFSNAGGTSYNDVVSRFKEQIKSFMTGSAGEQVLNVIMAVLAMIGIVVVLTLLALAYPIIRALTKIGAGNPGFGLLFVPIVAGLLPYMIFVLFPNIILGSSGLIGAFLPPDLATMAALLKAVNVTVSSGSVFAFFVALALFIFSFFYGHQRRKLKKYLAAAAAAPVTAQAPAQIETAAAPEPVPEAAPAPVNNEKTNDQ